MKEISNKIGAQGLILSLPIIKKNNNLFIYNYCSSHLVNFKSLNFLKLKNLISEIMLTDVTNEGNHNSFDLGIVNFLNTIEIPFILFGGIDTKKKINTIFKNNNVSAIGIGNALNYKEHAYQDFTNLCRKNILREPFYEKK